MNTYSSAEDTEGGHAFSELFKPVGGTYSTAKDPWRIAFAKKSFANYEHMWQSGEVLITPCKIYFDLVDNADLNALAVKSSATDHYFIGLYSGTVVRLEAIFNFIFEAYPVFSGTPIEKRHTKETTNIDAVIHAPLAEISHLTNSGQDRQRAEFAAHCSCIAVEYIIFHELAHILNGHVDRVTPSGPGKFAALGETTDPGAELDITIEERQAMELDADMSAAYWELTVVRKNTFQIDPQLHLALMSFALTVATHCFPGIGSPLSSFTYHDHPHNEVRYNGMLSSFLNDPDCQPQSAVGTAILQGVKEAIYACDCVFPHKAFPEAFDSSNRDKRVKKALAVLNQSRIDFHGEWAKNRKIK